MKNLFTEREAAEFLSCSVFKLQRDRRTGSPIPYRKIGKNVRYSLADLQAYLEQRTFTSTTQYGGKHE